MSRATSTSTGSWYFGWNIVAASTLLTMLTVGMRMGIGPFFLPMATGLGFSRSLLASIVAVGMLFYGLGMPLAGYLVARRGTKFVLLTGTAIVVASTIWSVFATSPLTFLLSFGVLLSTGLAFTSPVALTPVISRWFTRQRGMALFFLSTGSMAGIAVMTPVLTLAIEAVGWRLTLVGFAVVCAALTIPAALCAWAGCWDAWHSWLPQLALSSSMANLPCFSPLSQGSPVHSPCCWVAVWTSAHHHCAPPFQLVG